MDVNFTISEKQQDFIQAGQDEVLFGGAAGGGKSYGQLIDAFLYALKYKSSKQLILRRTFPELERSLIMAALELYPNGLYAYNSANHRMKFLNRSLIEFSYCDNEKDVFKYQSAEYDVIRIDELTHFTEFQYLYLISRIRGTNRYPKQMKCSTNPGGVGHTWVKGRFIDEARPQEVYTDENKRTRVFIPARVQDNRFLMEADPKYIENLKQLPENERKALLDGDWDIYEGQFFTEFKKSIHVINPMEIPPYWRKVRSLDYGLDMTACIWWAISDSGEEYAYRELFQPNLILSDAAKKIIEMSKDEKGRTEKIEYTVASPDLWNRRQDTGISGAEIMLRNGLILLKADNNRVNGWRTMREHLKPYKDEFGEQRAKIRIFDCCSNLIRSIPALLHDENNPEDAADEPHEITHMCESCRYFCMSRPRPGVKPVKKYELPFALRDLRPQEDDYISW